MPLASSNDLILAGVHDIVHALRNPSPGSALAPLTDSHHEALQQLTIILTSLARPKDAAPTEPAGTNDDPTLPLALSPDPALRVPRLPPPAPEQPTLTATAAVPQPAETPHPSSPATGATPLRVPAAIRKGVRFATLPAPTGPTFENSTGAQGKQKRRQRRQSQKSSPAQPAKTVHPNKLNATKPTRSVAAHRHGTRSKHLDHVAACARALLLDDALAPQSPFDGPLLYQHLALHGHAINPDTGMIAEYKELSQCSEGPIWQASNPDEIGRLAQGYGAVKGINTIFLSTLRQCQRDARPHMYALSRPCGPKKQIHIAFDRPSAATKSSIRST